MILLILSAGLTKLFCQASSDEMLANQYFHQGEYQKAVVLYESLFEKNPSPLIYQNYLQSLLALEEYRKADRLVRQQMRAHPGQLQYEVDLGWVMQQSGDQRRARRHFDGLVREATVNPQAVLDLSEAFIARGFHELALEAYQRGRRAFGNAFPFHLQIGALYEKMGRYKPMMEEYLDYLDANLRDIERVQGMLQDAITNDPDFERNEALREVLLTRTQKQPANTLYSEMLLWLSLQQKDFRIAFMQARALDRRMRQDGQLVLEVAMLSASNENYAIASQAFQYVLDKGEENPYYLDALVGFLEVRLLEITASYDYSIEELKTVEADYLKAISQLGINAHSVKIVRNLARLQAFYLRKPEAAVSLLESVLNLPNVHNKIKAECRVELADILLLNGDVWDATLLYSQVDKAFRDDPLGHEAKYKNARLSFYIGEFDWAKAQLDVLKAGTSRLIANDAMKLSLRIQDNVGFDGQTMPLQMYARAEMLTFRNLFDEALLVLDSVIRLYPSHQIHDDVLFAKAQIKLKTGHYHQADSLLASLVEMFPEGLLADEALFQRARIHQDLFNDKQQAMALYQKLIVSYPGSLNTLTARQRFRSLRGDLVN